jgi:hypothetical protein
VVVHLIESIENVNHRDAGRGADRRLTGLQRDQSGENRLENC